ncbi:MAG: hypothetical protein LBT92_02840 [Rickettsiales bacterium]|jgi:hypothetical protein|nr:hypothetical protein [Rickettsiales bacterium]
MSIILNNIERRKKELIDKITLGVEGKLDALRAERELDALMAKKTAILKRYSARLESRDEEGIVNAFAAGAGMAFEYEGRNKNAVR